LQQARQAGGNHRAALESSLLTEHMVPALQGPLLAGPGGKSVRAYDGYYLEQLDATQRLDQQARLLPIAHRLRLRRLRTNRQFEASRRFTVPLSSVYMIPVRHWASVLAANVLGMPGFFLHTARRRWLEVALLPFMAACRSQSLSPGWCRAKTYMSGGKCNVAASAHVETSILGRRVRIEPQAVVRNSVLGDFVQIRAGAVVDGCSLGPNVIVETGSHLRGCVAEEGACIGTRFVQISIFGRECVVCPDSGITDFVLRGTIRIDFDGRKISSGSRYLGGCIGDGVFLGPNVGLPGGTEIPNGCQLIPNPRTAVTDVQSALPDSILRVDRGRRRAA
jgi:carbonic anhydrase/acetyltransferase-like protein (isoleucine patch superfamily)